jgi:hypothetical protein
MMGLRFLTATPRRRRFVFWAVSALALAGLGLGVLEFYGSYSLMRTFFQPPVAAGAIFLTMLVGCSGDKTAAQVGAMNKSNIQRLANMYSAFQNQKSGRGPNDATEFKGFIKDFDPANLTMRGIDPNKLDALFTSERDSKPFKIRYQVGGGRGSVSPVIFEEVGSEGKKQVGFTGNSKVEDVDDTTYAQLWSSKGSTGPAAGPPIGAAGRPKGVPKGAQTAPDKK